MICSIEPYAEAKDAVEKVILRFPHHLSIVKTKKRHQNLNKFYFTTVTVETMKNIINGLPQYKSVSGDVPLNE